MPEGLYLSLASLDNNEFLLWRSPGKHNLCVVPQNVIDLLLRIVLQICAVNHTRFGIPTTHKKMNDTNQKSKSDLLQQKHLKHPAGGLTWD